MRRLLHIPIVHGSAEMGSARNTVRRAYIERGGEDAWEKSRLAIAAFWDAIETAMDSLRLDYRKARLYQDGLPVCGLEEKIVRDLAMQGVPNHRILLKLMERGASLEGTEHPDLLRTEYELIMNAAPGANDAGQPEDARAAQFRDLLDQRDRFVARRIDTTLGPDEMGILFLGAMHRALEWLPDSIEVVSLPHMLRNQVALDNGVPLDSEQGPSGQIVAPWSAGPSADEKRPASNELLEHDPEKWEALARSCSRQPRAG